MRNCTLNLSKTQSLLFNHLHHKLPKTFVKAACMMGGGPGRLTLGATNFRKSGNSGALLKAWCNYVILQQQARRSWTSENHVPQLIPSPPSSTGYICSPGQSKDQDNKPGSVVMMNVLTEPRFVELGTERHSPEQQRSSCQRSGSSHSADKSYPQRA